MRAPFPLACAVLAGLAACAANTSPVFPPPVPASATTAPALVRAEAPAFAVGEEWEFDYRSDLDPAQNARYAQAVSSVSASETAISLSGGRSGFALIDANTNYRRSGASEFEPSDQRLEFPLFVGKSWTASYLYRNGSWRSECKRQAKVEAVERVETPAGIFEAFRIAEKTLWQSDELYGGSGVTRETLWYAPSAKRIVKSELRDSPAKGPMVSTRLMLLRHTTPAAKP